MKNKDTSSSGPQRPNATDKNPKENQKKEGKSVRASAYLNKRIFYLSLQAIFNAIIIGGIAKLLMLLIHFFTNVFFYGKFSFSDVSPGISHWGIFVILVPIIGGVIVGIIARYGSAGIRGHGIPEAMSRVLTNESKVPPIITILKPLASAIAIGTGGPFGAEGPAIATGGAFGSLSGQVMRINANERKIILAAGACAGMAAIFGSPIASVMLGLELLLFEFSPRSIIPVILSCATAASMHYLLFSSQPIFAMLPLPIPSATEIITYTLLGLPIGILAAYATKGVYFFEDLYKKLPIHWMWWPAIGGIAIGVIGYFAPKTFGVGYSNIDLILSGHAPLILLISFCVLKYFSWAISLGSGTAGGTLAPLFTMGGGLGALLGMFSLFVLPGIGINVATAGLIGMAAFFAGASGALLTSIIFVLETTGEMHDLLPVVGATAVAYFVAYFILKGSSIMTLEIERKGIKVPTTFEPDLLMQINVKEAMHKAPPCKLATDSIETCRQEIEKSSGKIKNLVIINKKKTFQGIVNTEDIENTEEPASASISKLISSVSKKTYVYANGNLQKAVELMDKNKLDYLPVLSPEPSQKIVGIIDHKTILSAYNQKRLENKKHLQVFSLKRRGMGMFFKK